jgi:hypothetical protein
MAFDPAPPSSIGRATLAKRVAGAGHLTPPILLLPCTLRSSAMDAVSVPCDSKLRVFLMVVIDGWIETDGMAFTRHSTICLRSMMHACMRARAHTRARASYGGSRGRVAGEGAENQADGWYERWV